MEQTAVTDPEFVTPLKGDITGIYFTEVERFTPEKIEREFRRVFEDRALAADEKVVANLMFLVRKRNVRTLLPDVERVFARGGLKPRAEMSTMKTLFALGGARERGMVDERLSQNLGAQIKSAADMTTSPFLDGAERIGGPRTLQVLQGGQAEFIARQRSAEQTAPNDHTRIGGLDKARNLFETKAFLLGRKLQILALPESNRAWEMVQLYLRNAGQLGFWAQKELVDHPSEAVVAAVRSFVLQQADKLLPPAGLTPEQRAEKLLDYRLRGMCLLQLMNTPLSPAEAKFLGDRQERIQQSPDFYLPRYDWEDVLDQH